VTRERLLKLANDKFDSREYETALFNFSLILQQNPDDKEARTGAILTEMAMNEEQGAEALHDYYTVLQSSDKELASEVMEEIITSMDGGVDKLSELLSEIQEPDIVIEDGISYADFKELIADRGDFKRTFEDIMFSTRVVISDRDDFIDFLGLLAEHGFDSMAANYIESALQAFPNDEKIRQIYRQLDLDSLSES
jgi:tetratricopeptide (TPR) repeat protein